MFLWWSPLQIVQRIYFHAELVAVAIERYKDISNLPFLQV
jgi:hypothetical protein